MEKRYYIQTFGCQMNVHDSEHIASLLNEDGYVCTDNALKADIIILNTCSIREKAAQKVYSQLGRFREYKQNNPRVIIGIGGCLAQQWGKTFLKRAPYLDLVFGTQTIHRIPELIRHVESTNSPVVNIEFRKAILPTEVQAIPKPGQVTAYVTIMQGCNNFCSYCVVPYLRGREQSRDKYRIVSEVKNLAANGIREVTLLGQNVNSYGNNLGEGIHFAGLLREIATIDGIERIRFTTSHPKDLSPELIRCFAEIDKLCEHIHLPVQSGADRVLEHMNRGYFKNEYLEKVSILKESCPEISVTSDIIVGFPGETDEDFQETIDLMEKIRFDNLFTFKYSEREGTIAAQFNRKVSDHIKDKRLQAVQSLQQKHSLEKNVQMVGQLLEVLVECQSKNSPEEMMGRTRANKIANFKGRPELIGKTVPVFIKDAYLHSLHGEIHI